MDRARCWLPALLLLLLGESLAACDFLDEPPPNATATIASLSAARTVPPATPRPALTAGQRTAAPAPRPTGMAAPTPAATATPAARPAARPAVRPAARGYTRHTSTIFPYAIDYPAGWRSVPGGAAVGATKADLFVGGQAGNVTTSVTVYRELVAEGVSSRLFLETGLLELADAGVTIEAEEQRTAAGVEAFLFTYTTETNGQRYAISQAVFVRDRGAWVLTLTTAPDDIPRLRPVLGAMLESMQVWE